MPASRSDSKTRSGIILAGGQSKRMGTPKALVEFRGRPLITRPFELLADMCSEVVVARGPALDARLVLALGDRAVFVEDPGSGPLAALHAAAQAAKGEWLLVAPCDAPFLTRGMYEELLHAVGQRDGACFAVEGVPNPLVAALRREMALYAFAEALDRGQSAPRDAFNLIDVMLVPGAPQDLVDLDTPDDVERAQRL